jgi:AmmeMemoRadiSam system protein A
VTLHVDGQLRGCLGTFSPRGSLAQTVAEMAKAAATEDPRFSRLRPDELGGLSISVSALRTPHLLEDRTRIEVGVHGLVVRKGWNRGVLLPKVAVEAGWDGPTFLKHCCLKAGLPAIASRDPELVVEVFEADEFGEEQPQ